MLLDIAYKHEDIINITEIFKFWKLQLWIFVIIQIFIIIVSHLLIQIPLSFFPLISLTSLSQSFHVFQSKLFFYWQAKECYFANILNACSLLSCKTKLLYINIINIRLYNANNLWSEKSLWITNRGKRLDIMKGKYTIP